MCFLYCLLSPGYFFDQGQCSGQDASSKKESAPADETESVKPGINKNFLDPNLDIEQWLQRFEVESREVYQARDEVLKQCQIKAGDNVADIGAGTGFYTRMFSSAVQEKGKVFAVDIAPGFIDHLGKMAKELRLDNVQTVLCTDRSARLPFNTVDVVFICDAYHHFEYPQQSLASIFAAMKPGATLVLIDFERIPGKSREFILGHVRANKEEFRSEFEKAGFAFLEEVKFDSFEENYFLRFQKPKS